MYKTKVRIAVALNQDGEWFACGGSDYDEEDAVNECLGNVAPDTVTKVCWVEAVIPPPKIDVVFGVVKE